MTVTEPVASILKNLDEFVGNHLNLLKAVSTAWQPQDFLPDMAAAEWYEKTEELRKRAAQLSDEVLVVLVGNLVTEEALPSYQTWLNRIDGVKDKTGADGSPWASWTRGWTAEENRHGDVLGKYLYLGGRVNMRAVEITIQHLIRNGFDLQSGSDPYQSLVYAAFQERATKIAHLNTGRLVEKCGDGLLGRICSTIAADEARHEEAYKRFFGELLRMDTPRAVMAFARMMSQKITMPARLMSDGTGRDVFTQFAIVAQKIKVYTMRDYADVIAHLVDYWRIEAITGLTGEALQSQDYLCGLSERYSNKADRVQEALADFPKEPFLWIYNRSA